MEKHECPVPKTERNTRVELAAQLTKGKESRFRLIAASSPRFCHLGRKSARLELERYYCGPRIAPVHSHNADRACASDCCDASRRSSHSHPESPPLLCFSFR